MIGIKKNPRLMQITYEDKLDLIDVLKGTGIHRDYVPEQERNFDAGYSPVDSPRKFIREEVIDGKKYKVFQA